MLDAADALVAAREVIAQSDRLGLPGTALAEHIRAMRFAVDAGRAEDAVFHARASAAIDDDIMPSDLYPAEKWLGAWRAWQLAGQGEEARAALSHDARWVRRTLRTHVPEPFRASFVRANPVNQQLLRAAAQERLDSQADADAGSRRRRPPLAAGHAFAEDCLRPDSRRSCREFVPYPSPTAR